MPSCDMCGSEVEKTIPAKIEGSVMKVCINCAKYGEVQENRDFSPKFKFKQNKVKDEEIQDFLVSNYSKIVKKEREKMNLTQEEMAKKLNLKESLIHQIESNRLRPNLETTKKLEKFFNIHLMEKINVEEKDFSSKNNSNELTIGDIINKKLKNK